MNEPFRVLLIFIKFLLIKYPKHYSYNSGNTVRVNNSNIKEGFYLSNKDETRKEVLADKFPEMDEHFKELKKQAYEPKIERLGQTTKEQKK